MKLRIALLPLVGVGVGGLALAAAPPSPRAVCDVTVVPQASTTLQYPPNTEVYPGFWVINSGTTDFTVTAESGSITGAGTYSSAVGAINAYLEPEAGVDANVIFTTASSGSGKIHYNVTTTCGTAADSIDFVIVP